MATVFGITGQRTGDLPHGQFANEWLNLGGFEQHVQSGSMHFYVSGNDVFHSEFDAASFFVKLEKDLHQGLNSLKGLFCGAIWLADKRELIVLSDPFGVYPIYYAHNPYKAIFSGSLRDLANSGEIEVKIDAAATMDYFRFNRFFAPNTLFSGVKQLEPGQFLRIHEDYFLPERYWDWSQRTYTEFLSVSQVTDKLNNLFPSPLASATLSFPLSFQTLTDWVSRMDTPVDGPWRDPSKTGAAETLCSNPVFHELLTLMKKKWPMSFPVFLRAYLAKFGFWKWPGLSGRWRKERMLQEYWDVEFLYQFEELNWSDDRLKRFFDWTDYPKNGLFLFLNERIGYGKSGFSLPASGRVSYSEWHHKILAQSLPIWRATADNQYDKIMLPYFHKEWVSYGISIPDGLKDSALEDSLAKRYKIQPTSAQPFKLPLPTENEWRIIEKGLSRLPFVNIQELMDAVKKQPECFRGITILGLWLETQIHHEQN